MFFHSLIKKNLLNLLNKKRATSFILK